MDWVEEVQLRLKRKNQVLFSKQSDYLQELLLLFQGADHRATTLWALDFAAETVEQLEGKYPGETRPREALEAARDWAAGRIKMRIAQRKILSCHAVAKELRRREDIARCHAVGQACAVVHTAGHAVGYPIYDLTAMVCELGIENCAEAVEARKQTYIERALYWNAHWKDEDRDWADFMVR